MAFRNIEVQGVAPAGSVVAVSIDGKHRFSKMPRHRGHE